MFRQDAEDRTIWACSKSEGGTAREVKGVTCHATAGKTEQWTEFFQLEPRASALLHFTELRRNQGRVDDWLLCWLTDSFLGRFICWLIS